jgi:hypothetical protein
MLYNYCRIGEDTEVAAKFPYKDQEALIIIETADEEFGFKTLEIEALSLTVIKNYQFSDLEVEHFKTFISNNLTLIYDMFDEEGEMIA